MEVLFLAEVDVVPDADVAITYGLSCSYSSAVVMATDVDVSNRSTHQKGAANAAPFSMTLYSSPLANHFFLPFSQLVNYTPFLPYFFSCILHLFHKLYYHQ